MTFTPLERGNKNSYFISRTKAEIIYIYNWTTTADYCSIITNLLHLTESQQ